MLPKPIPPDDQFPPRTPSCTHCGDVVTVNRPAGMCHICWGRSRTSLSCPVCGETFSLRRPGCLTVETEMDTAFARAMQRLAKED